MIDLESNGVSRDGFMEDTHLRRFVHLDRIWIDCNSGENTRPGGE